METKGKGEMCAHPSGQVLPKKIIYLSERQGAVSPYYVWPHSSIEVSFGQEGKCGNEGGGGYKGQQLEDPTNPDKSSTGVQRNSHPIHTGSHRCSRLHWKTRKEEENATLSHLERLLASLDGRHGRR